MSSQVSDLWAHVDLNHGPHPYQGCALTGLSYGPRLVVKEHQLYKGFRGSVKSLPADLTSRDSPFPPQMRSCVKMADSSFGAS